MRAQHGRRGARVQGVRTQARVRIRKGRKIGKAQAGRRLARRNADRCVGIVSRALFLNQTRMLTGWQVVTYGHTEPDQTFHNFAWSKNSWVVAPDWDLRMGLEHCSNYFMVARNRVFA